MDVNSLSDIPPWEWPDDAGETLLDAIRGDAADDEERLLAIEMASSVTVMNDEIAEALLALLRDSNESDVVRGRAAIALGPTLEELDMELDDFDDPEDALVSAPVASAIRGTLRQVYLDPGIPREVRRRALEASVRAQEDWHAGAVRAAYHSDDREWKLTAVFCMAYIRGFDDEILQALESEDEEIRYEAIRASGEWGLKGAWPHVRSILRNDRADKPLLLAAIEAVPGIQGKKAADVLGDLLDSDDPEIADAASEALAMATDREGVEDDLGEDEW